MKPREYKVHIRCRPNHGYPNFEERCLSTKAYDAKDAVYQIEIENRDLIPFAVLKVEPSEPAEEPMREVLASADQKPNCNHWLDDPKKTLRKIGDDAWECTVCDAQWPSANAGEALKKPDQINWEQSSGPHPDIPVWLRAQLKQGDTIAYGRLMPDSPIVDWYLNGRLVWESSPRVEQGYATPGEHLFILTPDGHSLDIRELKLHTSACACWGVGGDTACNCGAKKIGGR